MPSDPLNLEPKNGDFVDYIESLQASSQKNLDGITPPMTADHHIGLPPNAAGRADDGISLKDLIAAFRRKTGMPQLRPRIRAEKPPWRGWSRRPTPMLLNPSHCKTQKLDPAAKFAVSICWMLGFMGTAIGVNEDQPAVLMFAAFVFFVGVILASNSIRQRRTADKSASGSVASIEQDANNRRGGVQHFAYLSSDQNKKRRF